MKQPIIQFGENVDGYTIPVLNEREIRAAAGIMFLATFISLMFIIMSDNFVPIKYVVILFFIDFSIRIFVNPRLSPVLIVSRQMVSNQNPEYVGAKQKKFAWLIGFFLSGTMLILMVFLNTYSIITGIVCLICLILMFFETAFGICIGCKIYNWVSKDKAQYCPGEICDIQSKQDIQKTAPIHYFIVLISIVIMVAISFLFNENFKMKPTDLLKKFKVENKE
ncbi:MAG: DUF4395 domain-containing protein [Saprospiraceae bacterium]|nr:DUF4395 domain-containing protein [Saprospiraceae bacterium]